MLQGNLQRKEAFSIQFCDARAESQGGKYAAVNGTTNAIRHFSKEFPNLKESTMRGWRSAYLLELNRRTKEGEDLLVNRLPQGKIGCPLLHGETLDQQVQAYLSMLRDSGGVINTSVLNIKCECCCIGVQNYCKYAKFY